MQTRAETEPARLARQAPAEGLAMAGPRWRPAPHRDTILDMRVLLIEDEDQLARRLVQGLREEGYAVDCGATLAAASELALVNDYDVIILDLMLPDGDGLTLLGQWRREGLVAPVLLLTARDTLEDKVHGLDQGADDYLTKPFDFDELLARLRSLLRRPKVAPRRELSLGELRLDRDARTARVRDQQLNLTAKELAVLEQFLLHPGHVIDRVDLLEHAWDDSSMPDSNVIDVVISRLRRKIAAAGGRRLLHTVKGLGYVLREQADSGESDRGWEV